MTKILIIDDNPGDIRLIKEMLIDAGLEEFSIIAVNNLFESIEIIRNDKVDVVLLDLGLPDSQGLVTLKSFFSVSPPIPIVVLTSLDDEGIGTEAVRIGAQDFIVKERMSPIILAHSLLYAIERKQYEIKLEHLNRVLFGMHSINQLITTEKDTDKILEESCSILVENDSYNMVWIAIFDENLNFTRVFQAGFNGRFTPLEDQLAKNILPNCCKKALSDQGIVIIKDPISSCPDCPLRIHYGNTATIAGRLKHLDKIYGVLVISLLKDLTNLNEEIYLFHEIANDIAFALHSIELATERRLTEQALKISEEKYRAIFEEARDGIVLIDINTGYIIDCNKEFERQTARSLDQLRLMQFWDTRPIDQREEGKIKFLEIRQKGTGLVGNLDFLKPNGQTLPIEYVSKIIRMGGKLFIQSLTRDITERQKAERILRESEELYKTLVSAIPDAIIMLDLEGKITFASPQTIKLYRFKNEKDIINISFFELIVPDQYEKAVLNIYKTLNIGVVRNVEYDMVKMDSTLFKGQISTALIRDANGEPKGYICVIQDITDRKELEECFQVAHKMEAVGRLAGGIAHDFNNMLTVVLGHCEMMLKLMPDDSPYRKFVKTIEEAGQKTVNFTRQMLAFSSKQVLEPRAINLNKIILDIENILYRVIREDIQLIITLSPDIGHIVADPGQIEQVIMNMAINARDAMPKGGKLIIETSNIEFDELYINGQVGIDPGRYVLLAITDTGCGMNKEVKNKIFEPFFSTKDKGKGTGLGLANAYGIVRQSGGHILVYSEPDYGTTFKICFPRMEEEDKAVETQEWLKLGVDGSEKILVVEDERFVRELIHNTLTKSGYQVIEAMNGDEALKLCVKNKGIIDLVLTDIVLPGMNGRMLVEQLMQRFPNIKTLYMSGYTDNSIINFGVLDKGMNFIMKPFTPSALKLRVRELLDKDKENKV